MKGKKMKNDIVALGRYDVRPSPGVDCSNDPGLTKQSFKDECDINQIVKRYETTGQLPDMIKTNPQYGDFSQVGTYMDSLEIVSKAHEQFEALNAHIRARFDNDPAKFLDFASDPKNLKEMVSLGLAVAREDSSTASTAETSAVSAEGSK